MSSQLTLTTIVVQIASEGAYHPDSLRAVAHDIVHGDCSGRWEVKSTETLSPAQMAEVLITQGSDPSFFQLDETQTAAPERPALPMSQHQYVQRKGIHCPKMER